MDLFLKSIADVSKNIYEKSNFYLTYYTNKDTAIKIIDKQELWMRKINLMNDYSEFEYGKKILESVLKNSLRDEFDDTLKIIGL